ncbi:hypothetical protein ACJX0J_006856, partial [Zea mays]
CILYHFVMHYFCLIKAHHVTIAFITSSLPLCYAQIYSVVQELLLLQSDNVEPDL